MIIICSCLANICLAQVDSSLVYLRFPTIPPFSITKVPDSTKFTKDDLAKKKATLIFIFSPDCEHCQLETRALLDHIKLFKKVQIIMASPLEHEHIKQFYELYKIDQYPNITMGRDPTNFFTVLFRLKRSLNFYKARSFYEALVPHNFSANDDTYIINTLAQVADRYFYDLVQR